MSSLLGFDPVSRRRNPVKRKRKTNLTVWNDYANAIKSGEIPACKRVKQAVERYFSDLNDPRYEFDTATVERFIAFSRLCPHVKGPLRGQPIELEPWQQFAFANLLGFKVRSQAAGSTAAPLLRCRARMPNPPWPPCWLTGFW
jgi:hypothetical protein